MFTAQTQTSVSEYSKGIPNIIIDGNGGSFVANQATIRGTIYAESGIFDNCTINETCKAGSLIMVANKLDSNGVVSCGYISGASNVKLPSVSSGEYKRIIFHNPRYTRAFIPPCLITCEVTSWFCINGVRKSGVSGVSLSAIYAEFHGFYDDNYRTTVWDIRVHSEDGDAS